MLTARLRQPQFLPTVLKRILSRDGKQTTGRTPVIRGSLALELKGTWSEPDQRLFRWRRNAHGIHSSFVWISAASCRIFAARRARLLASYRRRRQHLLEEQSLPDESLYERGRHTASSVGCCGPRKPAGGQRHSDRLGGSLRSAFIWSSIGLVESASEAAAGSGLRFPEVHTDGKGGKITLQLSRNRCAVDANLDDRVLGNLRRMAWDRRNCQVARSGTASERQPDGKFHDVVRHTADRPDPTRSVPLSIRGRTRSQSDPLTIVDLFYTSGITRGLPAMIRSPCVQDPENSIGPAEVPQSKRLSISYIEMKPMANHSAGGLRSVVPPMGDRAAQS